MSCVRLALRLGFLIGLSGCIDGLTQVAGTGALYYTRCSSEMDVRDTEFVATCRPSTCAANFTSGPVSHVVVSILPGERVIGYAERVCIQDLSQATGLFSPAPAPIPPPSE